MTELRQRMDDAMVLRGFALRTRETYLACVAGLAKHYRCSPDRLDAQQIQSYLLYLIQEKKLAYASVSQAACACRFLFGPLLNFEWVTVHEDGSPRPGVKGGRSPAQRTLDAWNRAIRWSMAGCGAVTHPAIETRAVFG